MSAPRDVHLIANRLRHHLLEWGAGSRTVLLLHGFLEHAHVWDWVAPRLATAGYHVYALDWRGHGDSQWVGAGGYYHFLDYVADLAFVVPMLAERVALVAHSMGGGAALLYAGTEPLRVRALATIEGLGVPDFEPDAVPERVRDWIGGLARSTTRVRRPLSLEAAASRLRDRFPRFSDAVVRHLVVHGTRGADGDLRQWKFDPLHQTRSPQPTYAAQARAFWHRVSCPVLYVEGAASDLHLPAADLEERLSALRAQRRRMPGLGHHPHLEQPDELARLLVEFLGSGPWE